MKITGCAVIIILCTHIKQPVPDRKIVIIEYVFDSIILVISNSAMLPFSATGGGRKTTLMKGGVCVEYIICFTLLVTIIVLCIKK